MKKRFLGLPVPIIAIGLAILVVGGGALAAFFMQRDIPSTVQIVGAGAEAYEDEACTIELTALDFGAIEVGATSASVSFWIKNSSDEGYDVYTALSQAGLDSLLILYEGTGNVVPEDPSTWPLATGSDYVSGYWDEQGWGGGVPDLYTEINDTDTTIQVDDHGAGLPSTGEGAGVLKIEDELISYTSASVGGTSVTFSGCTRGHDGTAAVTHSEDTPVLEMAWVPESGGNLYNLAPGEVLPVSVYLEADPAITRADYPFTLTIYAQDTAY